MWSIVVSQFRTNNGQLFTEARFWLFGWCGDHGSPCAMPQRDPAAFADVGSGLIRGLVCVSELVETRIARWLAGGESKGSGGSVIRIISSPGKQ
jgi:hypothetical protein